MSFVNALWTGLKRLQLTVDAWPWSEDSEMSTTKAMVRFARAGAPVERERVSTAVSSIEYCELVAYITAGSTAAKAGREGKVKANESSGR